MVSQQICPACATPNSTYAHKCRNCAATLTPRSLPADPAPAWGVQEGEAVTTHQVTGQDPSVSTIEYEAVPRPAEPQSPGGAAHDAWPAERLTPSTVGSGFGGALSSGSSSGVVHSPGSNGSDPWSAHAAPPDPLLSPPSGFGAEPPVPGTATDSTAPPVSIATAHPVAAEDARPPVGAEAIPAYPEVKRAGQPGSFSFHLGAGAGAAAGNGHHPSAAAPAVTPGADAPSSTAALAAAEPLAPIAAGAGPRNGGGAAPSPASPAPAGEGSGGRGWAVRESRTPTPAWAPLQPVPGQARPGSPPSAPGYSAGSPFFAVAGAAGDGAPGAYPWAPGALARPRSSAVKGLFAVLLLVVLLVAGGFWYFAYGPGAPKVHAVSAPATLGGLQENTGGAVGQVASSFQAKFSAEPGVRSAVYAFYGDGQSTSGYLLGLFAMNHTVNTGDLAQFVTGFNSAGSGHFDLSGATGTAQGGVTYRCGPVSLSVFTATLCVWDDVNVIGWVIGLPGVTGAATLAAAEEARSTGEH